MPRNKLNPVYVSFLSESNQKYLAARDKKANDVDDVVHIHMLERALPWRLIMSSTELNASILTGRASFTICPSWAQSWMVAWLRTPAAGCSPRPASLCALLRELESNCADEKRKAGLWIFGVRGILIGSSFFHAYHYRAFNVMRNCSGLFMVCTCYNCALSGTRQCYRLLTKWRNCQEKYFVGAICTCTSS